jgi:hypothetical protein
MLSEKEHFSDYVFEDIAADLLKKDPALKQKLDEQSAKDPNFIKNANAQLEFIYLNSPYHEKTFNRYPVGRLMRDIKLDLK